MSTQIIDLITIIKCLIEAEENYLGPDRQWEAINSSQEKMLEWYRLFQSDVKLLEDLVSLATNDVTEANQFLTDNGFSIQLDPLPDPLAFFIVSILDRLVNWEVTGEDHPIHTPEETYPGFRLEDGVDFFDIPNHPHLAARLATKTGDYVWLTYADQELKGIELADKVVSLVKAPKNASFDFDGAVIPDVMIDQQPDISWLVGLFTFDDTPEKWFIAQALQQAKFAMNKEGARIKVATAVAMMRECAVIEKPDLIFDRPFFLWIEGREGSKLPLGMMYVDTDSWTKADLDAL